MNHPRTLIREHMARTLVRNGAWADAVFVSRTTPISEDDHFPNVCIYTQSERTRETTSAHTARQEVSLLIEVRERRDANMLQPWRHIDGLPNIGAQTSSADRLLDDACLAIENLVFKTFSQRDLVIDGVQIFFHPITEVNTDITQSGDGIVPFCMAQIEFKLTYEACFDLPEVDTCPLLNLLGEIRQTPCSPSDPPPQAVPVTVRFAVPAT